MDVYRAVQSRQSIRAFTDREVTREVLDRVLSAAARAPSGGNLQPWHIYVAQGDRLTELKKRVGERIAAGDCGDKGEFDRQLIEADLRAAYSGEPEMVPLEAAQLAASRAVAEALERLSHRGHAA